MHFAYIHKLDGFLAFLTEKGLSTANSKTINQNSYSHNVCKPVYNYD